MRHEIADLAGHGEWILFFDEADALFGSAPTRATPTTGPRNDDLVHGVRRELHKQGKLSVSGG